ncbi:MAG: hypothetical protein M1820_001845 [Bogoriella megaspora]|nr:MAG: hypothetical protein M1820_001845 [Bogoriella megaspora]
MFTALPFQFLLSLIPAIYAVPLSSPLSIQDASQSSLSTAASNLRTIRDAMDRMVSSKYIKPNSQFIFQATIQLSTMDNWPKEFFKSDRHEEDVSKTLIPSKSFWHPKEYSTAFLWCSADNAASPYNYCDVDILIERIPGNRGTKGWKKTQLADTTALPEGFIIDKVIGRTTFEDIGWMAGQSRKDKNAYDNFVRMAGRAMPDRRGRAENAFGDRIDGDSNRYFKALVRYFETLKANDLMYTYTPAYRLR